MVTDIADEAAGVFHIWGNTPEGASVLLRVHDFQPYFYIAGPVQSVRHAHCIHSSLCHAENSHAHTILAGSISPPNHTIQDHQTMSKKDLYCVSPAQ